MRKLVPLHKQSKKQRKEYNAKQRGSWNGISPVTRIVPNGKYQRQNAMYLFWSQPVLQPSSNETTVRCNY